MTTGLPLGPVVVCGPIGLPLPKVASLKTEVRVTVLPPLLVVSTTVAGTGAEVVTASPAEFVVVIRVTTLVGAADCAIDVVRTTVFPPSFVDVTTVGTITAVVRATELLVSTANCKLCSKEVVEESAEFKSEASIARAFPDSNRSVVRLVLLLKERTKATLLMVL